MSGGNGPGVPAGAIARALPAVVYPQESRRRREQGVVKLAIEILPDGSVGQITVVSDPGYPRLVQAAVDAVRKASRLPQWQENGAPVRWVAYIPFNFYLQN